MDSLRALKPGLGQLIASFVPIVLWTALWLSIGGGNARDIIHPAGPLDFLHGLRAIFPFAAASLAMVFIVAQISRQRPQRMLFVGPLGLVAVYGLVGVFAALNSPDGSVAIFWTAAYLTVPLVLWSVTWGADPLGQLYRLINFTWVAIILAAGTLFAIALIYMDLGNVIQNPAGFFRCEPTGHWYTQTSGVLRSTGVGRYAALAAIFAFSGIWQGKSRCLWSIVLLVALMLLITTGARTSMIALFAALGLVTLLYGGKKAAALGVLALMILVPIHFLTNIDRSFLDSCFLHKGNVVLENPMPEDQTPQVQPPTSQTPQVQPPIVQPPTSQTPATAPGNPESQPDATVIYANTFVNLSGRTRVWEAGLELFKASPYLGYGFHGDRLKLGTHMHNAYLHALVQTGLIGAIPFLAAFALAWLWLLKVLRNLSSLPDVHKHLVIQMAALLAFLTVRTVPESTGAFFGVDWLLLALVFLYLQVVSHTISQTKRNA